MLTRRDFIIGCSTSIAAFAGGRVSNLVFARDSAQAAQQDILVVVFLRGGCDALSLIAPTADADYNTLRPQLRVRLDGEQPGLLLNNSLDSSAGFALHPAAAAIKEIYDSQQMAIVHACGLTNGTRSHFDAMDYMERGTPDDKQTPTGWLTRHLALVNPAGAIPALASSSRLPTSLLSSTYAVAIAGDASNYRLGGHWKYGPRSQEVLKSLYAAGETALHQSGASALASIELIDSRIPRNEDDDPEEYEPEPGAQYPDSSFSDALKTIAQMIKLDVGLQVATVDYGGWDTHDAQQRVFGTQVENLSAALAAFYNDLAAYHSRLTILVQSEFGRRLRENNNGGTDHGHGGMLLLLGGNVNGGRMYGTWPGLANENLDRGVDLQVTTDYRIVLSEILERRLTNPHIDQVFPGLASYQPLGVVR